MTPERWQQIREILEALDDCPREAREDAIAAACTGDADLRREVESLLSFEDRAEALDRSADRGAPAGSDGNAPERIGPYRVERRLGSGGMGSVFLAIRDDDHYRKQVAIKLIQWAGDPETASRFRTERQVLASLDHPNIARLLDGGALPDGQPYLVMEYIDGQPIDAFVRDRAMEIEAVLRLFLKVCSAVQFAHRNLIVHRDIKAGNILVSEDGEPHLLDFGIAKLLNPDGPALNRTQPWQRILTPASASPEQAAGGAITTASDVYSLGVLLFTLLTGAPFYGGAKDFAEDPARAIREYEPPPASETSGVSSRVRRLLAGDLDNIVRKATAKEAASRYGAVEEFSADLNRYLDGHPVTARPASAAYRFRKFAGRNWQLVSAAALLMLTILGGAAGTAWYAYRANLAEAHAEHRFESLHRLANSMLFEVDDALVNLQGATAARAAVVNRTLQYLDEMASDSSNNKAVLTDLATAYIRFGRIQGAQLTAHLGGPGSLQNARRSYEKALEIRRRLAAAEPGNRQLQADVIYAEGQINATYLFEGDLDRALAVDRVLVDQAKTLLARSSGHDRLDVELRYQLGGTLTEMGSISTSLLDIPNALDYLSQALDVRMALLTEHPGDKRAERVVGISHNYLCMALEAAERYADAVDEERQALTNWEPLAAVDPANADIQSLLGDGNEHLCLDLARTGKFSDALDHCRASLRIYQAAAKADPNDIEATEDLATSLHAMSDVLDRKGEARGALEWEARARGLYQTIEAKDPDSLEAAGDDATSLLHFGMLEARLGSRGAAEKDLRVTRDRLEAQTKQSPKDRQLRDLYDRAATALAAVK